ncbi:MAG: hypothetical protein OXC57_11440 [Rhodobacteraceae bacterium]|nr:hypothetical protein [Paracoccaceae bacterium]
MSLDELDVPHLVDKARQKKKVVLKPKPKTCNDGGFTEKDAERLAEQNPEIASLLRDPETIQALKDAYSDQDLRIADE